MKTLLSLIVVLVALTATAQNMTVNVPNLKVYTNATVGGKLGVGTTVPQSPISLGKNSASPTQRIALYEEVAGTFFYGLGVAQPDTTYGLALYGGTGGSSPTNDNWWVYLGNDNVVRSSKPVVITNSSTSTTPLTINSAGSSSVNQLVINNGGVQNAAIGPNGVFSTRKAFQQYQGTLTHAGTTTLDFDGATTDNYMVMTGAVTLLPANLATNRNYSLTLFWPGITNAPLYWPTNADGTSAMNWQGYAPTNLWPTNKTFTILLKARGANDTNVTAVFGGQY